MPLSDKEALYNGRKEQFAEELKQVKSRLNGAALLRLVVFLATVAAVYFFHEPVGVGVIIALVGITIFLFLIRQFADLRENKERLIALVSINKTEAAATN